MFELIKEWKNERYWKKEYGTPRPQWVKEMGDKPVEFVLKTPEFKEWLSRQSPKHKDLWARKMNIIYSALDQLSLAIDNEIISRGGEPDLESQSYPNESAK
ncbi:MAG TPA: hypothetical protein VLE02_05210 [Nitrosarchaeum sp.]|nr:hypothetical protein [Nitrosarchaeum sp.]